MSPRPAAGALAALGFVVACGMPAAFAQSPPAPPASAVPAATAAPALPPPASPPPAPPPLVPPPQAQPRGAVVVAVSAGAGAAARALAYDVYRDGELRPSIDDATARVLAGDPPAEGAPPRIKELAELRASIVQAFAPPPPAPVPPPAANGATPPPAPAGGPPQPPAAPPSDLVARRLLASLGTELGALLVVSVGMDGSRPVARALRVATSSFERIELGPTVDIAPDGARTYRWPGAASSFHGLLLPAAPGAGDGSPTPKPAGPLAPKSDETPGAPAEPRPFYKSPWFWGSVGGAAAIGLGVFLISRATSSASNVHLSGTVGP